MDLDGNLKGKPVWTTVKRHGNGANVSAFSVKTIVIWPVDLLCIVICVYSVLIRWWKLHDVTHQQSVMRVGCTGHYWCLPPSLPPLALRCIRVQPGYGQSQDTKIMPKIHSTCTVTRSTNAFAFEHSAADHTGLDNVFLKIHCISAIKSQMWYIVDGWLFFGYSWIFLRKSALSIQRIWSSILAFIWPNPCGIVWAVTIAF